MYFVFSIMNVQCIFNIDEVKIARIALFEHENKCVCFCTNCIVLAVIVLKISIEIGAYFVYCYWYVKKDVTRIKFGTRTQTTL